MNDLNVRCFYMWVILSLNHEKYLDLKSKSGRKSKLKKNSAHKSKSQQSRTLKVKRSHYFGEEILVRV